MENDSLKSTSERAMRSGEIVVVYRNGIFETLLSVVQLDCHSLTKPKQI